MGAPRRQASPSARDRWLVSYADFITLLFAFFTTMYAISTVDAAKLTSVAHGLQQAFDDRSGAGILPGNRGLGRAERAGGRCTPSSNPPELGPRTLRPPIGPGGFEDRQRLFQPLAGRDLAPLPAMERAVGQQRTCLLEGARLTIVLPQGSLI